MLILELAVQSVRGFSPSARIALRAGYIGLTSPGEMPAPLSGLFLALAYPDGRGTDAVYLAPGAKQGRAGFSLQSDDQQVWRLVRDLGGQGALHQLNRTTNQFEVVTQDATEMAQMLRARVGLPDRSTFQSLFTFTVGQLPSKQPRVKAKTATKGPSVRETAVLADVAEATARIVQLEEELKVAKEVADYQFRLDGVQAELFKVEQRLKAHQELKQRVELARAELAQAPTPQVLGLPDDIVERVRRAKDDKSRFNQALAKLTQERDFAGVASAPVKIPPLYTDRRFVGALLLGLALTVAGGMLDGLWHWLALLSLVPYSVAALLALRFVEDHQHASREGAKGDVFEKREKKLRDEHAASVALIDKAFEAVGAATSDEFFAAFAKREELLPTLTQVEFELAEAEADPETAGLNTEVQHMRLELEELNEHLTEMGGGGYNREAREIERELTYLRERLAASAPKVKQPSVAVASEPQESFEDPLPKLLGLARDLFAADIPTVWSVLRERVLQYLTVLTDRRYHDVDVDSTGRSTVSAPGRTLAAGDLPGRDLDLLYLSTRLTIIEKWSATQRVPVLMEDAFAALIDGQKQPLFARMLKHVGTLTQVVHATGSSQPVYADGPLGC